MRIVTPIVVNDAVLTASNVPETDYTAWNIGTSYTPGDRVILVSTHSVYEAITSHTGNDPAADDGTNWIRVGSTNRWRAFDGSVGQDTSKSGTITYTLTLPTRCDSLVFIGLAAIDLRIVCKDGGAATLSDQTYQLLDTTSIGGWLDYFTYEAEYETEKVVTGLPAPAGGSIEITIDAGGGTAAIGEIGAGRRIVLGTTISGTRTGFSSLSVRNIDAFGNITIVPRSAIRKTEFEFVFDTRNNARIQRELERIRNSPAFFYADEEMAVGYGLLVFGYADDFFPALSADGTTFATLSVTGVA